MEIRDQAKHVFYKPSTDILKIGFHAELLELLDLFQQHRDQHII